MAKNHHTTNRIAPDGYISITRPLAEAMFNMGYYVILCADNVNHAHILKGWCLGYIMYKENDEDFNALVKNYMCHTEPELGRRPVFYVKCTDLDIYKDNLLLVENVDFSHISSKRTIQR
jgi:hypothetical protein